MTLIFLSSSHYFNVYLAAFIYPVQTGLDREKRKRGGRTVKRASRKIKERDTTETEQHSTEQIVSGLAKTNMIAIFVRK